MANSKPEIELLNELAKYRAEIARLTIENRNLRSEVRHLAKLKPDEKWRLVSEALQNPELAKMSDNKLAKHLGVSNHLVAKVRGSRISSRPASRVGRPTRE